MAPSTPHNGPCPTCDGPLAPGYARCWCCREVARQLGRPLVPVAAVTPYRTGDAVHRLLRGYKDAPDSGVRAGAAARLAAIVRVWLPIHGDRRTGRWDLVATVPSTTRPGPPPVDRVVARVPALAARHRPVLARGPGPTGHLAARPDGFVVTGPPDGWGGRRVLLVDDTLTTGARAQSAAAALADAGVAVRGVLVVGRAVDPEVSPAHAAFWSASAGARSAAAALAGGRRPPAGHP